ncbi:Profilin [Talaromyces pinophilus]|nr:Profilin [Talaromyces pinophilus]
MCIVGSGHVDKAIIIDQTGQAIWGKSSETQLSPEEMNKIAFAFNDSSNAEKEGITVEGRKYFFSKIDDLDNIPVLHCAKGKEGIIAAKCSQSILVSHYPESSPVGSAIDFIQGQAKHLIANSL